MTRFDRPFGTMPDVHPHDRRGAGRGLPTSGIDLQAARPAFGHADQVPVGNFRFVALDVETACSDAASICQIGLACVQPDGEIQTFFDAGQPQVAIRLVQHSSARHRSGPCGTGPGFAEALEMLLPLLTRHHLVQHSNFDKQAMNAACRTCGLDVPDLRWSDSVTIARRAWPELKGNGGHGLANLKRVLNLRFHHHDAGEDAARRPWSCSMPSAAWACPSTT